MSTGFLNAAKSRNAISAILQKVLAHETRLAATAHEFEWRVRGSPLQSIKRLFSEQSRQIDRWLSDVTTCAQHVGVSVFRGDAERARSPAAEEIEAAPRAAATELLQRHETLARELRAALNEVADHHPDGDAASLLGGLVDFHETSAWMLRLLLEMPERSRVV